LTVSLAVALVFGIGGFQAVVIQFGVDQLNDASTIEITSFVAWYTWTLVSNNIIANFINMITCIDTKYSLIGSLVIATCLTFVVSTNYVFSNQLIKEPVTQNPFKLVYNVVRYAIKTKHPRQRSAFTYWEDDPPSRMDFGKAKYGGPFTTEQVEDVKIFIQTIGLTLIASFPASISFNFDLYTAYLTNTFLCEHHTENILSYCFHKDFLINVHTIIGILLIPLNEFLLYPLFYRCIAIKIRWKVLLGTLLELAGLVILVILITYARSKYIDETATHPHNSTLHCLFHKQSNSLILDDIVDYRWFVLVEFLFAASGTMLVIGTIEFYCAQVPYSMKGLVAGCYYGCFGLCVMFNYGLSQVFRSKLYVWESNTTFSCGFWYLLTKIILVLIAAFIFTLSIKFHKKRKREDVLPNEHIFAEQYYSIK
jgi:peptide/histidine transporter 3/4